ncbi:hypothetical protein MVEN_01531400 [Mycena venus]|uniref:Ribosome biogenesis protein SLX9 n=1 Tax=Mycena venus TaxID=2733690 RepID=A0A8H7CRP8_9AGAR|nr:hypothetical protein MVEN_01531400 [Mycena venus]
MDTFSSPRAPARSVSRGKSMSPARALSRLRATRDYAVGIGLLLIVVILWTSSNFVTQGMYQGGFEKPFLVTYLNTSAFALYLVPFQLRRWWRRRRGYPDDREVRRGRAHYQPLAVDSVEVLPGPEPISSDPSDEELPPLTIRETARLAFVFLFIANWAVNASLDYTSVASATILSSMSGRIFHVGHWSNIPRRNADTCKNWRRNNGGVLQRFIRPVFQTKRYPSFGGVILVSLSDSVQPQQPAGPASRPLAHVEDLAPRPILGDTLALISALFYALYVILLKVRMRSESRVDMQLFFGFVGLFNILSCWPMGIFLHLIGVETLELPKGAAVAALAINMAITLSSDYLYVLAMLKTTPLVVTVGLSLTIPLAVLGDFILGKFTRGQVIFGALLVLLSFVVVGLDNEKVKAQPHDAVDEEDGSVDEQETRPKDRRKRAGGHEPSVKLVKRQFALQDNAVEHVDVGGAEELSAVELLTEDPHGAAPVLKKKEKQQLKREALLQRLESSHSPYSKSHARRLKRKAKEQLAGGDLDAIQMALAAVDDEAEASELPQPEDSMPVEEAQPKQKKPKPKPGQIGEGKNAPLSKAQRKRALKMEKLRHPLILANPEFSSNPFETIRTHAKNTLLQH